MTPRRAATCGMARMSGPGSPHCSGSFTQGGVGFDGQFGRRSRRAEEAFLGGAFLVAQARLEASDFFLQPVDDPLLFQTAWAIGRLEFRKG